MLVLGKRTNNVHFLIGNRSVFGMVIHNAIVHNFAFTVPQFFVVQIPTSIFNANNKVRTFHVVTVLRANGIGKIGCFSIIAQRFSSSVIGVPIDQLTRNEYREHIDVAEKLIVRYSPSVYVMLNGFRYVAFVQWKVELIATTSLFLNVEIVDSHLAACTKTMEHPRSNAGIIERSKLRKAIVVCIEWFTITSKAVNGKSGF